MPPKNSIFRGPEAQHFQLVHRSQRDPLINDTEASQRVLKPVGRGNDRKAKSVTLADLEASVDRASLRANEGEAALYGITYDDSSYDYMSHLKPIGSSPGDVFLIPGPRGSGVAKGMKPDRKGKGKDLFDLPEEVFASEKEMSLDEVYSRAEGVPSELQGLQPDMDPRLRQVLEALEDDAFVDDHEEGWFEELVGGGERDGEGEEWEFREEGVDVEDAESDEQNMEEEALEVWEDRFEAFKRAQADVGEVDPAERSEMDDTIGSLASNMSDMRVVGGKKRRGKRGPSDASGMSMSSSSMFRNDGLRTLDERFEKMEREYKLEDDEDYDDASSMAASTMSTTSRASQFSTTSTAPPEISRDDFDAIMNDFLDNYEVVGRRLRQSLGGTALSGVEKLAVLRAAIDDGDQGLGKEENRRRILELERVGRGVKREIQKASVEEDGEKWDVETILTMHTNTENHPAVIRSRTIQPFKTGAAAATIIPPATSSRRRDEEEETDSGSETEVESSKVTVARPKGETTEERRTRKAGVKAERSARRTEKKSHRAAFTDERKRQLASHRKMVGNGQAADLSSQGRGVLSLS